MKVVCNNPSGKKNSIKGLLTGNPNVPIRQQKIDPSHFMTESKKPSRGKKVGLQPAMLPIGVELNSKLKNSPLVKRMNNSSSSPGTRYGHRGTCDAIKTNRDPKHSKNISSEVREYFTGFGKRQVVLGSNNILGSPVSKRAANLAKVTQNSASHSHSKKRKTMSNLDDRNTTTQHTKRTKEDDDPALFVEINKSTVESLALLRMDSETIKSVLSNKQFRIRQSQSREVNLIESVFEKAADTLESLKSSILNRVNQQATFLSNHIAYCIKKVAEFHPDRRESELSG